MFQLKERLGLEYDYTLDDYLLDCSSLNEMAEKLGTSKKTIKRWLVKHYGLETVDFHFGALYSAQQKIKEYRDMTIEQVMPEYKAKPVEPRPTLSPPRAIYRTNTYDCYRPPAPLYGYGPIHTVRWS